MNMYQQMFHQNSKKLVREISSQIPFERYLHRLVVEVVYKVNIWLNCFPHKDGIHNTMSLRIIITGMNIDQNKHCKLEFRSYFHVNDEHDNPLTPHTMRAIALRPTENTQGTHYFLNISSRRRVTHNNWTVLLMPNEVIMTIHRLPTVC